MILNSGARLVAFILSFNIYIDHYWVMCEVLTCEPAEIGSNHEVKFNVTSNCTDNLPRVDSHEGVLARCPNYTLLQNRNEKYKFTLSKETSNYHVLTLMIYNITLPTSENSVYFNIDNDGTGAEKKCNILLYHRASELNCSLNTTQDGLGLNCVSSEMYPGGPCVFETNLKNGTFEKKDVNVSNTRNDLYIRKMCSLSVPVANLTYGEIAVNVTVYPNVTGNMDNKYSYGKKTTIVTNLEKPSVRLNIDTCPSKIKEGDNVTCHCEKADSSDVDVEISWYDNATHNNVKSGSILFRGNRSNKEIYYCKSRNIFGWESTPVFYQHTISFPQKIKRFSVNDQDKGIKLEPLANISFFCEVEEADNQLIEITKDGKPLKSSNSSKTIAWNLTSASREDTGVYRCNVSRYGEWTHIELFVTFWGKGENEISYKAGPDQTQLDIGILMSIVEAVLLVISWIIVALLCVKLRRYSNSKVNISTKENAELKEIRENDDGYLTPTDVTNVNIAQQVRGDYDSIEPHHGYESIGRVGS